MATIKLTEYECECDECDGVITYTKSDIVKGWETERFEDPLNYDFWDEDFYVEYIHCPNCNKKIYFKNIPFEIMNKDWKMDIMKILMMKKMTRMKILMMNALINTAMI